MIFSLFRRPAEIVLVDDAALLAWPGFTPLTRRVLEAVAMKPSPAPASDGWILAQAWASGARVLHALMTHPEFSAPQGMRWVLGTENGDAPRKASSRSRQHDPRPGLSWSPFIVPLVPTAKDMNRATPYTPPKLQKKVLALAAHQKVAQGLLEVEESLAATSRFLNSFSRLPAPSAPMEEVQDWFTNTEAADPSFALIEPAVAQVLLSNRLPAPLPPPSRSRSRL